jgi:PhzF family phenazine biosynthesis protein
MTRQFVQVDVFGESPFLGNPLAVVLGADGIDDDTMAAIARWTNLSETTFVLRPTDAAAD